LILFNLSKINAPFLWLTFHVVLIAVLCLIAIQSPRGWLKHLAFWSPIFIILLNFSELHYLIHNIRPNDLDPLLIQLDYQMFGVHPTLWLEQFTHPFLTEVLQIVYTSFYFLPIILIILLQIDKQDDKADFFIFTVMFGFYLSYIGYFCVPAIGPRFTLNHLQTFQLQGLFLTQPIRLLLDTIENIQRDAFPSGHTAITLITMFYAFKYQRNYFYILLVIGTSLIVSTVYLRYHYVADVIGGLILTIVVIWSAGFVYKFLNNRKFEQSS